MSFPKLNLNKSNNDIRLKNYIYGAQRNIITHTIQVVDEL